MVVAALVSSALPGSAQAKPSLRTGFLENLYGSADPAVRDQWFDRTVDVHAGVVRLHVFWRSVAATRPLNPRNPGDPAYNWGNLDDSVRDASQRGLRVLLTATAAPNWAEGANRPGRVSPGSWKPSPGAFGDFGRALAQRYSGGLLGLPRVTDYQAWNEQNLSNHLSPQYRRKRQFSARHYVKMLNAFREGVKSVHQSNNVVTGGTAPYGDPPGGDRTRPLTFWRKAFCLRGRKHLRRRACDTKARFDILAHHPINTSGGPHRSAINPNDASTPDFKNVVRVLRKAERVGNVGGGRHPAWATEIWWESDPPDRIQGIPLRRHARWLEEALYVLWKQGARVVINLQVRDGRYNRQTRLDHNTAGIFFHSGKSKPARKAWSFPFVAHRRSHRKVRLWGKAPGGGTVEIQRRNRRHWRTIKRVNAGANGIFTGRLRLGGKPTLRARMSSEAGLPWRVK
jgi:hypothetical protein